MRDRGISRTIIRTSEPIDRSSHNQSSRNIESIHEPAKVGNSFAEVVSRLDVEPDSDEEEYRETDNLDEKASFQDESGSLQFVEGNQVVEEHCCAYALSSD